MTESNRKTVVNSWNEWDPLKHIIVGWDPLKHIIVGRADGTQIQAPEPAVQLDFPDKGYPLGTYGSLPNEMEEKASELLDNFAAILEKRGVRVDRPTPLDFRLESRYHVRLHAAERCASDGGS
jgi:glycine amidinotransferase